MVAAYQLRWRRAIRLHVSRDQPRVLSRVLPRFVPVSASDLPSDGDHDALVFLADVRLTTDPSGADTLVHAPGCAIPGRLAEHVVAPAVTAPAVHVSGAIQDVALVTPWGASRDQLPLGVFVYGTLMRGEEREGAIRSALPGVAPVDGSIAGGLVHLGAWPGLVDGEGRVHGELFHASDHASDMASYLGPLLAVLDPIEDFLGFHVTPTEYVRVVAPVTTASGLAWAWTYRFVGDTTSALPIPSGRWRDMPRRLPGTAGMRRPTDAV